MTTESAVSGHALRSLRLLLEAYAVGELPQWELFVANARMVRLEPGGVLLRAGEDHPYVYFVQRGLLKAQTPTESGRMATVFFPEEGDVLASMPSLVMEGVRRAAERDLHPRADLLRRAIEGHSLHTITAIESSLLVRIPFRALERLAATQVAWARLLTTVSVMHAATLQADAVAARNTPEQRYRAVLRENPDLVSRLTQRDLANYLNITDVALSRIAKRVRNAADEARDGELATDPDPVRA